HRDPELRLQVLHPADDLEALRLPVDRGQVAEVPAPEPVSHDPERLHPAVDRDGDDQVTAIQGPPGILAGRGDPERRAQPLDRLLGGHGSRITARERARAAACGTPTAGAPPAPAS